MLDSNGVSIWQMALAPPRSDVINAEANGDHMGNGYVGKFRDSDEHESSESDDEDSDSPDLHKQSVREDLRVAIGFDDGCVRIYTISDADEFVYVKSLPRVKGEAFFPQNIRLVFGFSVCFA